MSSTDKRETPVSPKAVKDGKGRGATICHGRVIFAGLPASMPEIYSRTLRRLVPPGTLPHLAPRVQWIETPESATMTVEVTGRAAATAVARALRQNKTGVFGRRWHVTMEPSRALVGAATACLAKCTLVPPAPAAAAERALRTVPGFLTLAETPAAAVVAPARASAEAEAEEERRRRREEQEQAFGGGAGAGEGEEEDEGPAVRYVLASFVNEGSALHARAVLSGRMIGTSGVRLFVERRH